jgi:hypothetical protein
LKALIRVYGPSYLDAIGNLERIATENPDICVMNTVLLHADAYTQAIDWVYNYFKGRGNVSYERCGKILAKAEDLEGYDFAFVWMIEPSQDYINDLISRIDEALKPSGAMYTITLRK